MRIAFIGTQCNGKTTLINDFIKEWPSYKRPEVTYRDIIAKKKIKLNQKGDEKSQRLILDALIDEAQAAAASGEKNLVFDRCVLDNIVYSLWLNANNKVSDNFIIDCKHLAIETIKLFDVIFYLPLRPEIPLEKRKGRDIDPVYREEIDNLFRAIVTSYEKGKSAFLPNDDCPPLIALEGPPDTRLPQIKLYIKDDGNPYGEDTPSLIYT